jgi:hypothetical protein
MQPLTPNMRNILRNMGYTSEELSNKTSMFFHTVMNYQKLLKQPSSSPKPFRKKFTGPQIKHIKASVG